MEQEEDSISSTLPTRRSNIHPTKVGNSINTAPTIRDVLNNQPFVRYLLFNFLFTGSSFLPSVFIVDYGARWFAGCNPNSSSQCYGIDYTTLTFYNSVSTSMRGAIAFFFAGFVGRLSDSYGRKPFLLLHPILYSLQILPLLIASNFLWYLILTPCAGFVGASLGLSPMMSAYISDTLPPSQRTLGFAVSYGAAGLALLSSAIISLMVSVLMNDYVNFWIVIILYIAQTFYIWYYIPESLDDKHKKPINKQNIMNPMRPLLQITNNRIVFWISAIQFLITFMEVGILNICMVYILTELDVTMNDENYIIMFTFLISVSFGLFIATLVVLPMTKKYPLDCFWLKSYKKIAFIDDRKDFISSNVSEMSQMSNLSEISRLTTNTSIMTNQSFDINNLSSYKNSRIYHQYSADSMMDYVPNDTDLIDGNNRNRTTEDFDLDELNNLDPVTPQITYTMSSVNNNSKQYKKHHYYYTKKSLFAQHLNLNRNRDRNGNILQLNANRMPYKTWVDFNNLFIGCVLSFISLLSIFLVAWIHSIIYISLCGMIVGSAVGISFPSANGVATNALRNDEQGKGFGIIYAVKGITSAIAPFVFGTFYTYLVSRNCGPIIFLIGMALTLCAIIVIIFPLRWVLCDQMGNKRRNPLLISNRDMVYYNT